MMDVLSPRETGKLVSTHAKSVVVNSEGIQCVAKEVIKFASHQRLELNSSAGPDNLLPKATDNDAADFLFVADVMNFCFWPDKHEPKWDVCWSGRSYTGYFALCAALMKAREEGIPITDPKFYSVMTEDQLGRILEPSEGASRVPLLPERVDALRQAGSTLIDKFGGTFKECIKQAKQSARALVRLIVQEFPSFRDEAMFCGHRVSFYKRAQILVGDIWLLYNGQGLGQFSDIDELTVFADYRVPQVLVHFKALEYSAELMERLQKDELLPNGSAEEVEIRGCTIEAVERITGAVREHYAVEGSSSPNAISNATQVDHFLWNYRREHADELACVPFHKTRSIYY